MSMYDTERRYRRQLFGRIVRLLVTISVCVGIGIISYQIGVEDLQAEKRQHRRQEAECRGGDHPVNSRDCHRPAVLLNRRRGGRVVAQQSDVGAAKLTRCSL